jgi:hypothetical protein
MVAVQGENTVDVDDYQLKTSTFYEMSTYTLQKESNEVTVQYFGVLLDLRIPTQIGHPFRFKSATHSAPIRPVIPKQTGHPPTKVSDAG